MAQIKFTAAGGVQAAFRHAFLDRIRWPHVTINTLIRSPDDGANT
jgi:hypothetical protein